MESALQVVHALQPLPHFAWLVCLEHQSTSVAQLHCDDHADARRAIKDTIYASAEMVRAEAVDELVDLRPIRRPEYKRLNLPTTLKPSFRLAAASFHAGDYPSSGEPATRRR